MDIKLTTDARTRYKTAIKPLTKPPKDPLAWLTNWEEAITQAKEKDVPEAQRSYIWFEDFSIAIHGFMKAWIVLYKMLHKTAIQDNTLTFCKLTNDLQEELLKDPATKAGRTIAKGSFGPSFAKSYDTDNEQPKEDKYHNLSQ